MKKIGRVFENRLRYVLQDCLRPSWWSRCLSSRFFIGFISTLQESDINKSDLSTPSSLWRIHRYLKSLVLSSCLLISGASYGLVLTPDFEVLNFANVGAAGVAVSFDNVYANPVPVCIYNLIDPVTEEAATVRISALSGTGMTIYLQGVPGLTLTPGNVQCIIMDEGDYTVAADGFEAEARLVDSQDTNGNGDWGLAETEDVTADVTGTYTAPVVLGQVLTSDQPEFSTFWSNNCLNRGVIPFETSNRICVGKHDSFIVSGATDFDETLGYIVFEESTGILNGVHFEVEQGARTISGVDNPTGTYNLDNSYDYDFAIATQAGENGGNGSWAVQFLADPLAGGIFNVSLDEANNGSRAHTTEEVHYIAFAAAQLTLEKTVINDNGGTLADTAFTLTAEGPIIDVGSGDGTTTSTSQITQTGVEGDASITNEVVYPDTYALSEVAIAGYTAGSWSCVGGDLTGSDITLVAGEDVVCTITNDDIPTQLTLEKVVNNTAGGGTADAGDWTLEANIDGGTVEVSGTTGVSETVDAGDYVLAELNGPAGYTLEDLACDAGTLDAGTSTLTIGLDQDITCTFTNRDLITDLEIIKTVSNENPVVGETVTFELQVINNGPDDATNVVINDSVLAGFSFVASSMTGGDTQNQTAPDLVWTINSLPAGAANAETLTYQAVVNAP